MSYMFVNNSGLGLIFTMSEEERCMKKVINVVLTVILFSSMLFSVLAEDLKSSNGFTYRLNEDETAVITGTTKGIIIEIPDMLDGHIVSEICDGFFDSRHGLISIYFPDTLKVIGKNSFRNCIVLKEVEIPGAVQLIDDSAFMGCERMNPVTIRQGVRKIGRNAFRECERLSSIAIPGSVLEIGAYSFYACKSLFSVNIQEGVQSIGEGAFSNCNSIREVVLPASIVQIGIGAFDKNNEKVMFTVEHNSYAEDYCKKNGFQYVYSDNNDTGKKEFDLNCFASSDTWLVNYYVDAFENKTNKAYVYNRNKFPGELYYQSTKKESIKDASMQVRLLIDSNYTVIDGYSTDVAIKLYTFGKEEHRQSKSIWKINITYSENNTITVGGLLNHDRIYLGKLYFGMISSDKRIIDILQQEGPLKFKLTEEFSNYVYEFTIEDTSNFSQAYELMMNLNNRE